MSTAIAPAAQTSETEGDQCVFLSGIDWKGYTTLLRLRGERSVPRMVYLDGSVRLLSPSFIHENLKERLGLFVMVVAEEFVIPCIAAGSTTLRRRPKRGGVEGDQTYYLTNLDRIHNKKKIHLKVDPPPDLAIEVVVSHDAEDAVEVYRRLRVPEVWICNENQLTILVLQPNSRYLSVERSHAFNFLTASEIHAWVSRTGYDSTTAWIIDLRRWVVEVLSARYQEQRNRPAASAADASEGAE